MLIKPVSLPIDQHLLDTSVAVIRRSNIHLLTARRNAWHSTMLKRYSANEPAYSSFLSAWGAAEHQRKPGTYFEIDEEPSLVFDLDGHSLVVTHLNAPSRFSSWRMPTAMADRRSPLTGLEVLDLFASSRYTQATSGWRISAGEPDIIVGIVESAALATSNGRGKIHSRRSSLESGGRMTFSVRRSTSGKAAHVERIVQELTRLTHQKYPAHEIYQQGVDYYCEKGARKLGQSCNSLEGEVLT